MLGLGIGRIGCFLAGLDDGTHGSPTALPFGVDYSEGFLHHPVALYEMAFLLLLTPFLLRLRTPPAAGIRFKVFLSSYLLYRLFVEALKPVPALHLGLNAVQWACLLGLFHYFVTWALPAWTRFIRMPRTYHARSH